AVCAFLDSIQNVIETGGQRVDIFRVDRGDEGAIQPNIDFMNDLVAFLLERLNAGGERRGAVAGIRRLSKQCRRPYSLVDVLQKQPVKLFVAREQSHRKVIRGSIGLMSIFSYAH